MKRAPLYNALAVIVPILCLLFSGFVAYRQYSAATTGEAKLRQIEEDITKAENELRLAQQAPGQTRMSAAAATVQEQPQFLNMLRMYCKSCGVALGRISPASTASGGAASALPAGVIASEASIEVAGEYTGIRRLLYALLGAPRVFTVYDVKWSREQNSRITRATFTLARYLSTEAPPPPSG